MKVLVLELVIKCDDEDAVHDLGEWIAKYVREEEGFEVASAHWKVRDPDPDEMVEVEEEDEEHEEEDD